MKARTFIAIAALTALTIGLIKEEQLLDLFIRVVGSTATTVLLEAATGAIFPKLKIIKD